MSKFMPNVVYLESSDFKPDMSLDPSVGQGKPAVVMFQGNFCGYCTQAKDAFTSFCNESGSAGVLACTLQIDDPSAKEAAGKISMLDKNYRGVPTYFGFDKTGKYVKTHQGGRDKVALIEFAKSLR
jgi:thiol-disulfide isomerase/thioredoxin